MQYLKCFHRDMQWKKANPRQLVQLPPYNWNPCGYSATLIFGHRNESICYSNYHKHQKILDNINVIKGGYCGVYIPPEKSVKGRKCRLYVCSPEGILESKWTAKSKQHLLLKTLKSNLYPYLLCYDCSLYICIT